MYHQTQATHDCLGCVLLHVVVQAKEALVSSYRQLRAGDAVGGAVYRITVRQLEALVRLSEAHARIRCSAVIEPRDVREVRLQSDNCGMLKTHLQHALIHFGKTVLIKPSSQKHYYLTCRHASYILLLPFVVNRN